MITSICTTGGLADSSFLQVDAHTDPDGDVVTRLLAKVRISDA